MKVAIVHDQLREFGGAERVLMSIKALFPDAPVYTTTFDLNSLGEHKEIIKDWDVRLTWFGKIPLLNKFYSPFRFLTPLIWEHLDLKEYDLVISSTGSWMCKGVITKKPAIHISYIHHPPRYLYGYQTAIEWQKYWPIKLYGTIVNHFLRMWDYTASLRPDYLIANSIETQKRIEKFYRRDSTVIYPPVAIPTNIKKPSVSGKKYFITVSRLARAKHVDLLIEAANKEKFDLHIVGIGRDEEYLKSLAGPTVTFLGNISDEKLLEELQNAQAFLFAAVDEEFGIAPVEAMGFGVPVIAYASGGLKETVKEGKNGYLYNELIVPSLIQSIKKLQALSVEDRLHMRLNARAEAEQYSEENFKKKLMDFVQKALK
jgi:glycosyltransferase involved in cell wall biosynthesis